MPKAGKSSAAWASPAIHSASATAPKRLKWPIEVDPDDGVTIYAAVADPGEGNDSMLAQIAAHQLGLPLEKVRLYMRDTDKTVGMGPAAGSRMTFMAGRALLAAIENLQKAYARNRHKNLCRIESGRKTDTVRRPQ